MNTHSHIRRTLFVIVVSIMVFFYQACSLAEDTFFDFSSQAMFVNTIQTEDPPQIELKDEKSYITQDISVDMNEHLYMFGVDIFSSPLSDIMDVLKKNGYETDDDDEEEINTFGVLWYENKNKEPHNLLLSISVDHKVVSAFMGFSQNASTYKNLCESFTYVFGDPIFVKSEDTAQWRGDTLTWGSDYNKCTVYGVYSGGVPLRIQNYKNGTAGFTMHIETTVNGHNIHYDSKIPPQTLKPRKLYVSIDKVKLKKNSDGFLDLYVRFRNESSFNVIDRVDFNVICYDAYGDSIYQDDNFDSIDYFYDGKISPGRLSSSRSHWSLDGYYGVNYVMVAITKYHADLGGTVEQPMSNWDWVLCEY